MGNLKSKNNSNTRTSTQRPQRKNRGYRKHNKDGAQKNKRCTVTNTEDKIQRENLFGLFCP
jgi:hypothetical protein